MNENEKIEKHLNKLENKLKVTLPEDYRNFLYELEKNFLLYPEYKGLSKIGECKCEYLLRESPIPAYWFFHPFIGNEDNKLNKFQIVNLYSLIDYSQLIEMYKEFQSSLPIIVYDFNKEKKAFYKDYFPIADNGCGDSICICISGNEKGKIFYSCHEDNAELLLLANTFSEFLENCRKE